MLVPLSYNVRSLFVRRASNLLTVLGIAATVAVVSGVLALQQGFANLYAENGRDDVGVLLRPGATYEGYSAFTREEALKLMKSIPELAEDENGAPLAAMELYTAVRRFKRDEGETNVPVRGVQPATFRVRESEFSIVAGRNFEPGSDEVIVGKSLLVRVPGLEVGDVVPINVTPFRVVGTFACEGPHESEIWGDLDRMIAALDRRGPSRIVGVLRAGTDPEALATRLADAKETPAKFQTERAYLSAQTAMLSAILGLLGTVLGLIMGLAAVFTATNTMISALASRIHEVGILLSTGFRPFPIFLSFLFEALLLGLLGGVVGTLVVLPINGIETGTTNFQTFTEVAFAFRVTPAVIGTAIAFSVVLGLFGGAWPAWRAARLTPTQALRRH